MGLHEASRLMWVFSKGKGEIMQDLANEFLCQQD